MLKCAFLESSIFHLLPKLKYKYCLSKLTKYLKNPAKVAAEITFYAFSWVLQTKFIEIDKKESSQLTSHKRNYGLLKNVKLT